jgi:CheY-like chemotaxis protein
MENAQVVVFEDKTELYDVIETVLNDAGHEITAVADNIDIARGKLRLIRDEIIQCDVIVLDANFRDGMHCGSHAKEVMEYIEEHGLDVKVIGFSGDPMSHYDLTVDGEVKRKDAFDLPRAIGSLILSEERREQPTEYAWRQDRNVLATG